MRREKKRKDSNTEKPAKGKTKARTGYRKPKREDKKGGTESKGKQQLKVMTQKGERWRAVK